MAALDTNVLVRGLVEPDYSDCLHVALADQAGRPPLWTFDKAAAKVTGVRLLV
jgi:predicted nucleic acid-binding protein